MEKQNEKQKEMEAFMAKTMDENNIRQKDTLNGMMKSEYVGCSYEEKSFSLAFQVAPWQVNRAGTFHGGMIGTTFDITIAALARFFAKENFAPTVSLDIKYVRPISVGETLVVTGKATGIGKRISQFTGEAINKDTGKIVATAASVYLNVDTSKK